MIFSKAWVRSFFNMFALPGIFRLPLTSNLMNLDSIKFNKKDRPEFYRVLNRRVNQYFKENLRSKQANLDMKIKTVFMLALYFIPLILMLSGIVNSLWPVMLMWVLMGFGMAGLGLSVMHDAIHGSYSTNPKVNKWLGFVIHFIGGYYMNWKIQHNVIHHSFTNVHDVDEDIDVGIMRFSPNQERKSFFKFQAFYAPFLYSLLTLNWLVIKDFNQIFNYHKRNLLEAQGMSLPKALSQVIFHKIWYAVLMIVLPIILIDLPWWQTLIGFLIMHFICGMILSLIFQPAHVLEETEFFEADEDGSVENNWAIHQMKTTANFANGSRWFSWYVGGLNNQIEHHLFPNICHVHYRRIADIVKKTAAEYNLPYHEHKTFFAALRSHFTLLHKLGTGRYDRELAASRS